MSDVGLSHGSKFNNWLVWALAQRPIIWGFEPWLKGQLYGGLSHCSKFNFLGVWAIFFFLSEEIWFENSDPSLFPFCFCKFRNWQTQWTQLQNLTHWCSDNVENKCEVWKIIKTEEPLSTWLILFLVAHQKLSYINCGATGC